MFRRLLSVGGFTLLFSGQPFDTPGAGRQPLLVLLQLPCLTSNGHVGLPFAASSAPRMSGATATGNTEIFRLRLAMAAALDASGDYKILRRLIPRTVSTAPVSPTDTLLKIVMGWAALNLLF